MEVGVIIPNAGPKAGPENIVAIARYAEELGYHSVWKGTDVVFEEQHANVLARRDGRLDFGAQPRLRHRWLADDEHQRRAR